MQGKVIVIDTTISTFVGKLISEDNHILKIEVPRALVIKHNNARIECRLEPLIGEPTELTVRDWISWFIPSDMQLVQNYIQSTTQLVLPNAIPN